MTAAPEPVRGTTRVLWVIGALVAAGLVADAAMPAPSERSATRETQAAPPAGMWYCPGAVGPDEDATVSVVAVGDRPSIVTVERYPEGRPVADPPVQLTPGDQYDLRLPAGQATTPVRVRWLGGPTAASWRLEGGDAAAVNCAAAPAPHWHLAGFDTAGGARSFLHLFNPFSVDAVARVVFATPEGRISLLLTDNVLVPAGSTVRLPLNDYQPEQADLGASVEVLSGRLVAMGEVLNGVGRALVEAATAPAAEASFGFGKSDGSTTSWLSVLNPGERDAAVEVRVSDPRPEAAGLGEIPIPAGAVARIELADLSAVGDYGVTVASVNEQPIVAVRQSAVRTDSGRRGFALSLGEAPSRVWALPGGGSTGRQARVVLFNPGALPASVRVQTSGGGLPEWAGIVLEPNTRASVQLEDFAPGRPALGARVSSDEPIVAEFRLVDAVGTLRLWTALGVPEREWTGASRRRPARRDPALSSRPLPAPAPAP